MATIIEQKPRFSYLPVGQDVIFTVSNSAIVSNFTKVKFIANVHISSGLPSNLSTTTDKVGTFKTTPNNAGVGMFDFRPIIESFVKADNLAREGSAYKSTVNTADSNAPIHLIDKYSGALNTTRYLSIRFKTEYLDPVSNQITSKGTSVNSKSYKVFNGYLKHTDDLEIVGNDFGFNTVVFNLDGTDKKLLTNAPTTQYANVGDYGTSAILMINPVTNINIAPFSTSGGTGSIRFDYYDEDNVLIDFETIRLDDPNNGGFAYNNRAYAYNKLAYAGVFPANLRGWSTKFNANINNIAYYTYVVQTFTIAVAFDISETYRININCPTLKGFEPIRLTWLNQWGAWDYYTFSKKSTKTISTKGSTYTQLAGSWNESIFRVESYKGGKKSFRVNATEKIKKNTDFVSESESEWFEELINSPEVYILEGFQTDAANSALNNYVTPVRLTTSNYTRKTVANDKLMQYTFEVEKSKTLRTQAV